MGGGIPGGKANKDPVTELFGLLTHMLVQRILGGVVGGQSIDLVAVKFDASNAAAFAAVWPRGGTTPPKCSRTVTSSAERNLLLLLLLLSGLEKTENVDHVTFSVQ